MVPPVVQDHIQALITELTAVTVNTCRFIAVGGGSINHAYQLLINGNFRYFIKLNSEKDYPELFATEKSSLELLGTAKVIRIPHVVALTAVAGYQVLILEWIEQGLKTTAFWRSFGEQLALLHRTDSNSFGLDIDNYMGALPQTNTKEADWCIFFTQQRLVPQIRMARDAQLLGKNEMDHFERLLLRLPDIFAPEPPALLHGDLWSGNFLCDEYSQPVLVDPATYYGHRSMDLAMTTLFGGFDNVFYESYQYHYPLPVDYRRQWEVCNLYPLLVHLNLFGESYLPDILHTIQHY